MTARIWCRGDAANYSVVNDPFIIETKGKVTSFELMGNYAEVNRLKKELALHLRSQSYYIVPPVPYVYSMWQPWVKNFYGTNMGPSFTYGGFPYAGIDQSLKKQMGY